MTGRQLGTTIDRTRLRERHGRARAIGAAAACVVAAAGCSWIVGVSGDVQVALSDAGQSGQSGFARCGSESCSTAARACCFVEAGASCIAAVATCAGARAECSGPSDCNGGVCCVTSVHAYGFAASCKASCAQSEAVACAAASDCADAACVPWTCGGTPVRTCAASGADAGCAP